MNSLLLLAAVASASCTGPSGWAGADDEARPLFADGISAWAVAVPAEAAKPLGYAALELQRTIEKISGVKLGIMKGGELPKRNVIRLTLADEPESLDDVFSYRSEPGQIELKGNHPRCVLFAVYAFLRDRLGCRWYWPGPEGEFLPKLDRFEVGSCRREFRPCFPERELSICGAWRNQDEMTERWFPKVFLNSGARTLAIRDETGFLRRVSGHYISLPHGEKDRKACFEKHPEWFSLLNDERSIKGFAGCWSNEEYFDYLVKSLTKMIRENNADIANFYVADIVPRCQCEKCTADPDRSARFWKYYARLIEAIRGEIPGQHFAGLAYQEYRPVPGIRVEGVDYVDYCQYNRCYYHPFSDTNCTINAKSMEEFRAWRRQAPLGLYGYEFDVYRDPVYLPMWDVISDEMKVFREMGLRRVKTELSTKIANVYRKKDPMPRVQCAQLTRRLVNYCWAMLAFDPDLDPKALVRDFSDHVYGPAADAMYDYHLMMAKAWITMPRHITYFLASARNHAPVLIGPEVEKRATACFETAAAAAKDSPRAAKEVQLDREAFGVWQTYAREAREGKLIHELPEKHGDAYNMVAWLPAKAKGKGPKPQRTRFKLYRGKDALHLLVDCEEREKEWFNLGTKEKDVWKGTTVEIFLDTGNCACRQIAVNAAGGVWDALEGDIAWDSGVTVEPTVTEGSWQLDVTIPFSGLGVKPKSGDRWKFMVIRNGNVGSKAYSGCGWPINAHRDFSSAATLLFK